MPRLTDDELYQRLHVGNDKDIEFYLSAADGAKSILELGCGWGRVSTALVEAGYDVTGIDINPRFLSTAKERCPQGHFRQGDARTVNLNGQLYDRVFIPYNTLYAMGGEDGIAQCLTVASKALKPNGELWADVYPLDDLHEALEAGDEVPDDDDDPVTSWTSNGADISVTERTTFHVLEKKVQVVYTARSGSALVGQLKMTHHYVSSDRLLQLIANASMVPVMYFPNFYGESHHADPEQHIFCAALDDLKARGSSLRKNLR